ncbi:MAG: hypothetical protein OXI87_11535 [Albidovulum sp.]|nr:hypothetical protein [Albidovulum sp.]
MPRGWITKSCPARKRQAGVTRAIEPGHQHRDVANSLPFKNTCIEARTGWLLVDKTKAVL